MVKKILPTITTTRGSDWRAKIREINKLGLKEIAVFPTCLKKEKRKKLYQLLKKIKGLNIPLVHLRSDMELQELDFFVKNYNTKVFCLHTRTEYPLIYDYSKYKNIIYIENIFCCFDEKELKDFAGICLDFSHLENDRLLNKNRFEYNKRIIEKYPIGCNHISAIKENVRIEKMAEGKHEKRYDSHFLENLSEFNYLKNYPSRYFSSPIATELENSIKEQLAVQDYIANLIKLISKVA